MERLTSIAQLAARHPRITAILLGGLAATGFAPLGLWPVTLICIAGLIWLAERNFAPSPAPLNGGGKNVFLLGWCFGLGHFTVGNNWIAHAFVYQDAMPHWLGYFAVIALSLYLAIYPGFAVLGLYLARRRWPGLTPLPLFAALWVVTEYGRATIFTGFAWDPLGMIWLGTGVDQVSRVIGTYGLSALAILAGGALFAALRRDWRSAAIIMLPLALLAALGLVRMAAPLQSSGVRIAVVQPNIGQVEKYDPSLEQHNFAKLAQLTGRSRPGQPRLIFWPEAAIEAWLDMEPEWLERVSALERPGDLLLTGGAKVYFKDRGKGFYTDRTLVGANNSAWVVTPDGRLIARYDKAHLVPYGEYLPMRNLLEPLGLSRLVPGDADFWPGPGPRSLLLPPPPPPPAANKGVKIW
jgi:apolipoprotein N-acyltransferase